MTTEMIDILKQQGNEAFTKKDYLEAARIFTLAIDHDPTQHVLWSNRSAAHCALRDYSTALRDAEEAVKLAPQWAKGYGRKAAALQGMHDYEEAKKAYETGLGLEPGNAQMQQGLKQCNDAISSGARKPQPGDKSRNPFAIPDLMTRMAANPKTAALLNQPDFVSTLQELQRANTGPEAMMRHLGDARVMTALGVLMGIDFEAMSVPEDKPEGASTEGKTFEAPKPAPEAAKPSEEEPVDATKKAAMEHKEKGNAAYKQRDFDTALNHYHQALELDPTNASLYSNQAAVYFEKGEWDACVEACLQAVEVGRETRAPFDQIAKAYSRAGSACQQKGDLELAVKYFNKSLAEHRTPDALAKLRACEKDIETRKSAAYLDPQKEEEEREAGNGLFKAGKYADAVLHYTESIKRGGKDPRAYSNRAACYTKLGAVPEAIKDAETAIQLDPTFIKAYIRKANAELMKRDNEACLRTCLLALEADKSGAHRAEIQGIQMRCYAPTATTSPSEDDSKLTPEQRAQRAVERDPELQAIVADPAMRSILQQMQSDPNAMQEHMRNPMVAAKIRKLVSAGILRTA